MIEREALLEGRTYKVKLDHIDEAIYVTINDTKVDGKLRPLELFVNTMNPMMVEPMAVITRLVSACLRQGGSIGYIFKELTEMFSAEPFYYKRKKFHSIAAVIGELMQEHCETIGYSDE